MKTKPKSNKIEIVRIYDAPVKLVWDAWTEDKQVAKWWGPRGFSLTTHSKDLNVGGHWRYTMHGPDGTDYENTTKYFEVDACLKLVYDHGGHEDRPPLFRVTAVFTDLGNKTKLEMTMALKSPEEAEETKKFIKKANGTSTWDRLAEYLAEKQTGQDVFVIARTFSAPISVVFDMWTDPKHFGHWMGPAGSTMKFIDINSRTGGTSFYEMHLGGNTLFGKIEYQEITRPNRLVYKQWFSNAEGGIGKHPLAPTWPTYMLTTVQLSEEGPDETRISLKWEIFGEATPEERAIFHNAKAGMHGGWTGSFDKLDDLISNSSRL